METNLISPDNPLISTDSSPPSASPVKKPLNKKLIIYSSLFLASILLLIISSTIATSKKNSPKLVVSQPAPTLEITQVPTTPAPAIPTQYQPQIDKIETELKTNLDFTPPQVDDTIGL